MSGFIEKKNPQPSALSLFGLALPLGVDRALSGEALAIILYIVARAVMIQPIDNSNTEQLSTWAKY